MSKQRNEDQVLFLNGYRGQEMEQSASKLENKYKSKMEDMHKMNLQRVGMLSLQMLKTLIKLKFLH